VGIRFSNTPHPLDIIGSGQAKPAFHPFTLNSDCQGDLSLL
jgi:hypothetical protein